jgi:MFS family permease
VVAITGVSVLGFTLIAPALPDLADRLEVSAGMIGWVQGAVGLAGIFLAPFIGYVADRYGRRFVAVTSLLVFGGAGMLCFLARSFPVLVAMRAVQGVGLSGILAFSVTIIGDLYPPGYGRRRAMGINTAGWTVTSMVTPIVGGALAEIDAHLPFLVFGLALPLAVLSWRFSGPPDGGETTRPLRHLVSMFRVLGDRGGLLRFGGLLAFALASMVVTVGLGFTTVPLYLEAEFGIGAAARGVMQSFLSAGSTAGALTAARVAERSGVGIVFTATAGLFGLGFVLLGVAPVLAVAACGLAALGLGLGLMFPLLQDAVASAVPDRYRGAAAGVLVSSVRTGQTVGPGLGGAVAVTPGGRAAFLVAASLGVVGALAGWPFRHRAQGPGSPGSGGLPGIGGGSAGSSPPRRSP